MVRARPISATVKLLMRQRHGGRGLPAAAVHCDRYPSQSFSEARSSRGFGRRSKAPLRATDRGTNMGKRSAKGRKSAATPQPKKQDDSSGRDIGMSVDGFRTQLRKEVENV